MKLFPFVVLLGALPLRGGLLASYSFDTDFEDRSGRGNHLVAVAGEGAPEISSVAGEWVAGGGALNAQSTPGDQQFLALSEPIVLAPGEPWSIAFWARRRAGSDNRQGMVLGDTANTSDFLWLSDNPSQLQGLRYRNSGGTSYDFGGFPDDGAWHHWALVADGSGNLTGYRDNVSLGTRAAVTALTIAQVAHGYNSTVHSLNGQLDELRVYDTALSPAEIEELYLVGDPPPPDETPRVLEVYLLGGQSNADGRADPSGLPTSPVNLQEPQDDVDLYEDGGPLKTLRPGSQFGPEITLGRGLADLGRPAARARVAILKHGSGGTDLQNDWKGGGDGSTSGDGPLYLTFQQTVASGLAALAAAYPGVPVAMKGMVWVQGERDARTGYHEAYQANLAAFIADVRATYDAELPFVVVRLSSGQTNLPADGLEGVRAAQTAVAASDPRAALVDTDSFGLLSDNLHFDAAGQQQIGSASALALASFFPLPPPALRLLPDDELAISIDEAMPGFVYTLQTTSSVAPPVWSDAGSAAGAALPVTFRYPLVPHEPRRFFRIARSPAP